MKFSIATKSVASYAMLMWATASFSHVVLQDQAALANTSYRATLRVGHGCDGSPVTALRVTIPAGSLLAQWQSAASDQDKARLAQAVQKLLVVGPPEKKDSPDSVLYRQLASWRGPLLGSLPKQKPATPSFKTLLLFIAGLFSFKSWRLIYGS